MDEEMNKKGDGNNLFLRIIAISLVIIAASLGYFTIKSIKDSRVPIVSVDQTAIEIKDAQNTTYDDSLVSRMIQNTDKNAKWNYFIATAGIEVVEVNGSIPLSRSKDKIIENLDNECNLSTYSSSSTYAPIVTYSTYAPIVTNSKFDSNKVKEITFRIQFVKNIDTEPEQGQVYNRYYRSYAELCVTPTSGSKITIKAHTTIFPFLYDCLNDGLF